MASHPRCYNPRWRAKMKLRFLLGISFLTPLFAQPTLLPNNMAPWLATASKTGRADASQKILVSVYVKLQNEAGLQKLVHDLYTPGNPQFHRFLTPEQFRAAYSPDAG